MGKGAPLARDAAVTGVSRFAPTVTGMNAYQPSRPLALGLALLAGMLEVFALWRARHARSSGR